MTDRRIEIANISRVNEIIQDDPKAEIIKAYDETGLFVINYYESKGARKRREAQEAQIRQYQEWKAKEQQQQPQPTPANSEVRRGPGRPPKKNTIEVPAPSEIPGVVSLAPKQSIARKVEEAKSKGFLRRKEKMVPPSSRCVVCGSPDANVVKFHVPGAPTDGETRFCKTHSNLTTLEQVPLYQVG